MSRARTLLFPSASAGLSSCQSVRSRSYRGRTGPEGGGSTGKGEPERSERRSDADGSQGRGGGPALVDVDPWGALLESLLEEPAEPNSAPRPGGKRK